MTREPALIAALVQSVLGLLIAFGVELSDEQVAAVLAVTGTVLALLVRARVTPTRKEN